MSSTKTQLHLNFGAVQGDQDIPVDISLTCSHRVEKLLVILTDSSNEASAILWINRTPDVRVGTPLPSTVRSQEASNNSSLVMCVYGLQTDRPRQRYALISSGRIHLSAASSHDLVLTAHSEYSSTPSLFKYQGQEMFSMEVDKAQSQVTNIPEVPNKLGMQCLVLCQQSNPFQEALTFRTATQGRFYNLHTSLTSRREVKIKVMVLSMEYVLSEEGAIFYSVQSTSDTKSLVTYNCLADLEKLRSMAAAFRSGKTLKEVSMSHFYRNRWTQYFLDILTKHAGLMAKYMKDRNGDPHSAINDNLQGLFFSASPDFSTLQPPASSNFGEWRLHVPAHVMFHRAANLYFADFYCHNEAHYVTLVMTNAGSEADQFCETRLLKLDPFHNEFLYKEEGRAVSGSSDQEETSSSRDGTSGREPRTAPTVKVPLTAKLHVEVFYTENLDLAALTASLGRDQVFFKSCQLQGRGRSQPGGIKKKEKCSTCNLPD